VSERTRLVLVRHAQPAGEMLGRCYGTLDVGLSPAGRRQARLLSRTLASMALAALYTSPSARALDTAAPIAAAHGLAPLIDARLCEIDFGDLEGRRYDEIEGSHPEIYRQWMATPTLVQFPGGESYGDLRIRALAALEEIRSARPGKVSAVVAHAGVLRTMIASCLLMPSEAIFRLDQHHGAISVIDWIDSVPVVRLLNEVPAGRGFAPVLDETPRTPSAAAAAGAT